MTETAARTSMRADLPAILILAVIQGGALYGLHQAIQSHAWPATRPPWLLALYASVVFVPLTLQLLIEHARRTALWVIGSVVCGMFFYFGWHHGSAVADRNAQSFVSQGEYFPMTFALLVWWLLLLPFLQNRLAVGRWLMDYPLLFRHAWRNVIGLAEAALFTGLLWLLLELWQTLFRMLGIGFFRELFQEPIFVYPVTALAFGCALHLIGSIDRLVSAVLEQILNVLKWLGVVAGILLALFTVALLFKLPQVVLTGAKVIGADDLMWLVAVVVLLLNAAYRDGTVERPYPKVIAQALRWCVPLLVVIAGAAFYALVIRADHYGLTVQRVWAFVVATAALVYAVGYSLSVFGRGAWLKGIARINVLAALTLLVIIGLALTPVLSPYRLAANSQYQLIVDGRDVKAKQVYGGQNSYTYLGFASGQYGRRKLEQLARLQGNPNAELIRTLAALMLKQSSPAEPTPVLDAAQRVAHLNIYPAGRSLDAALAQRLTSDWSTPTPGGPPGLVDLAQVAGVFADLDGDGVAEFVLTGLQGGPVYRLQNGNWEPVARLWPRQANGPRGWTWENLKSDLSKGPVAATPPQWLDLSVGPERFRVETQAW